MVSGWIKVTNIPSTYSSCYWLEMYFLPSDPNYGWVCGFEGAVLRTTDGGNSWRGTTILNSSSNDQGKQLESIQFISKDVGYTSGPYGIYKSTDGGATWKSVSNIKFTSIWGISFTDENNGVAVGEGCSGLQRFFRTTNGGNNWYYSQSNIEASGMSDVILYDSKGIGYAVSSGYIWNTSDGGYNWSVMSQSGDNDWQEDLAISGNSILVPFAGECGGYNIEKSGLRMTTDFGKTWKETSVPYSMFGCFLLDEKHGWAAGYNGSVYYTSDGGQGWVLDNNGVDSAMDMDDIFFINDTTGWLVGNKGIYRYSPDGSNSVSNSNASGNSLIVKYNASNRSIEVKYNLSVPANVKVSVYNLLSERVLSIDKVNADVGENTIIIDNINLQSGIHFISLVSEQGSLTKKIMIEN